MQKICQEIKDYLDYCEKVRQMSPATMRSKRNICQRFAATTEIESLERLTNEVFNRWVPGKTLAA